MTDTKIQYAELELIITEYLASDKLKDMNIGFNYYKGEHDILKRIKYGIGANGDKVVLKNVPNHKIIDNQFSNILDQKVNYLFSKTPSFNSINKEYIDVINSIFDYKFFKLLLLLGKDSYKYGISWLYVYYDEQGDFKFKKYDSREIIPIWKDTEHLELDKCIRIYKDKVFNNGKYDEVINVELYTLNGIEYFEWTNNHLTKKEDLKTYLNINGQAFNWNKIPIIPFKANELELPLIKSCKSIQDAINEIISDFRNDLSENSRNTILVIKNYGDLGQGEFRENLNTYGYIAVGDNGGVETLNIQVNSSNYESILKILKKAMYENAKGFDAKSDSLGANPNQMNIQSMYSDIDLDANNIEREFQYSINELIWFIKQHLILTQHKDFTDEKLDIVFNRDILINESQAIDDCVKSMNILSTESILAQHPWVTDVEIELKKKNQEGSLYPDFTDLSEVEDE